jgi:anti-anti-sigma regulatory factor
MPTEKIPFVNYRATGDGLYMLFESSATHRASLMAEHLLSEYLTHRPSLPNVTIDLHDCGWVDSTFAGWMIKTRKQLQGLGGVLRLARCPSACQQSLDVMGLTPLFEAVDAPPPDGLYRVECPAEEADAGTIRFMLGAHEELADLNADNERKFKPVAEQLRRELDGKTSGSTGGG